ncbi:uncharacterized protein LOC133199903 [Saccostrea echinata]|uniref:uncharacterized protein LOC133199903 n=1 Tax=Saccostrea echinata TaxID=191078 RepID=UPI002A82746E|nr:uncharacterized protein LOC133199903 [Saccostrea echinata]
MIFRELMDLSCDWDDPLPWELERRWTEWKNSAGDLSFLQIPRMFTSIPTSEATRTELHVYSDASEQAVAAVAYLKVFRTDDKHELGFVFGKSKLSPKHGHTIPRLELCSAVLSSEIATAVTRQQDVPVDATYFYSEARAEQWNYISSEQNPADVGTRGVLAKNLKDCQWWKPPFQVSFYKQDIDESFQMVKPDDDVEVRPLITAMKVEETENSSYSPSSWKKRFCKFSSWERLVLGMSRLRKAALEKTFHVSHTTAKEFSATELLILKIVQKAVFGKEIQSLTSGKAVPNDSPLSSLYPYIDEEGVLRALP